MLDFDLCVAVLSETDQDGFIGIQIDGWGEEKSGLPPFELHGMYGSYSRPLDPEVDPKTGQPIPGRACNVLRAWEGDTGHAWLAQDPRVVPNFPPLLKGEHIEHGPKTNFTRYHADGAITRFTTADGTPTGESVYDRIKPDGWAWAAPCGTLKFDGTGFHVLTHSGARLDLGGLGGMPAPLDSLGAYAILAAPMVRLQGAAIVLGPKGGLAEPVAKATALQATLASISAALVALQASVAATPTGGAGSAPAVAAAVAAIAAAAATIPSLSTAAV